MDKVTDAESTRSTASEAQCNHQCCLAKPLNKGASATYTFVYSGTLSGSEEARSKASSSPRSAIPSAICSMPAAGSPWPAIRPTASPPTFTYRFPHGYRVIGSGSTGSAHEAAGGLQEYDFKWTRPGFPGTIIAGKFDEPVAVAGSPNVRIYLTAAHKQSGPEYAQTANKEFDFFSETFGESSTRLLNVVELPDDTVPAYWAPEIAAVAGARIADRNHFRLLANTMAHQWWGSMVSPASLNDAWIINGMARYGELMYVEKAFRSDGLADRACSTSLPAPWPTTPSRSPRQDASMPSRRSSSP